MGSCVSKCKPKKTSNKQKQQEECQCLEKNDTTLLVQDKLVISQAPSISPLPSKSSLVSPPSPSKSSSSSASFSCTKSDYPTTSTSSNSSSCSSLSSASSFASSTSSSILNSKLDRSFSNDYLWSCVKENPHIIRPDYPMKITIPKTRSSLPTRSHASSGNKLIGPKQQPPSPQRVIRPVAQKRARCSSPSNLTRQKSFRSEPDKPILSNSRELRPISPSPSRRFKGEAVTTSMRRENFHVRPRSPSNVGSRRYSRPNNSLVKKENEAVKRAGPKIEELAIGGLVSAHDMDWMPMEDVNNPHIALDCFIFL